jgi:SAM-dependent methyltransferase
VPIAFAVFAWTMVDIGDHERQLWGFTFRRNYLMAATVVVALAMAMRPVRFGLSVGLLFVVVGLYDRSYENVVFEDRGFFGLARVREIQESFKGEDGKWRVAKVRRTLIHGGINHGQQLIWPPEMRRQPITYFHPSNGIGEIYHKLTWGNPPNPRTAPEEYDQWMKKYREIKYEFYPADARMPASMVGLAAGSPWAQLVGLQQQPAFAVVGLGTGTLAVHAQPFQHVDFFEIDPMVKRLSVPPSGNADDLIFYYVDDASKRGANLSIILGDGRLKIKDAPRKYYHAISLDAFSSDAIPVHLLTKDAVAEYLEHLADGGVLIFNTTNRYVRIQPVLAAIAEELGMECLACPDWSDSNHPEKFGADWTVLRRSDKQMDGGTYRNGGPPLHQRLDLVERWEAVEPLPGKAWTDKYSNLLRVMKW